MKFLTRKLTYLKKLMFNLNNFLTPYSKCRQTYIDHDYVSNYRLLGLWKGPRDRGITPIVIFLQSM